MSAVPIVNTHVHVPPNFSAFTTPSAVIERASAEGVGALGISNFYDQQVYARFAKLCKGVGIVPLFGLEFITLDDELAAAGCKVNDPANPGRFYLCGKGIDPFTEKSAAAQRIGAEIRRSNDERAHAMVRQLAEHLAARDVAGELTPAAIEAGVAAEGGVPVEWVSLQERHIAKAIYGVVANHPDALPKLYGGEPAADPADPVATQVEIRARLLKSGTPGFVAEVPLNFADAYAYILAMKGIPTFPILADGAPELSRYEWPVDQLAKNLRERGIHAAELIPNRNTKKVVDAYVEGLTAAGILVMAGTEHNTKDQIPFLPACTDGQLSTAARAAFFDATCVVAAHQARVRRGERGFVDETGRLVGDRAALAAEGEQLIRAKD